MKKYVDKTNAMRRAQEVKDEVKDEAMRICFSNKHFIIMIIYIFAWT